MAGTSLGSLKGWGTRLIRKKNPELTFDMAVGILIEKYKSKSANDLREALINEFGVSPESNFLKNISVDAYGEPDFKELYEEEDGETFFQIESYKVPPGTWVKRDAIKSWIRTKGITPKDSQIRGDYKTKGETGNFGSFFKEHREIDWSDESNAKRIDRLAYLIARKWHREGYTAQMKVQLDDKGNVIEYRNKHAPLYILDKYGKIETIEKV